MESNKIIAQENKKAQIEEVREIENKEQKKEENKGSKVIEKLEETVLPTAHASDDEREKEKEEGTKQVIGTGLGAVSALNPLLGVISEGTSFGVGATAEGIGKIADNEGLKIVGRTFKDAPTQPFKGSKK